MFEFRKWISKRFQVCLPLFWGRWFTPLPFNVEMTVVVGRPVPRPAEIVLAADGTISAKSIDEYHEAYLAALTAMYERHKGEAGYPAERKLVIVES